MFAARHNFGVVRSLRPEALGVPGKRIFRMLADGPASAAATLWVEKEQIYGLSMAIKKMLEARGEKEAGGEEAPDFPRMEGPRAPGGGSPAVLEFKVSRLGLAYGPGEDHITLFFHDERDEPEEEAAGGEEAEEGFEEEEEEEEEPFVQPALQLSLSRSQSERFVEESLEACASGRGTDALSRGAMVATGRVDPNRNGYFRH